MKIIKALQLFGLSEKEAKVYLAGLELGTSSASDIALKSNLPRTLVYDLIERLINLGLASYSVRQNKKYFTTADPKELSRILKEKQEAIQDVLPELENLNQTLGIKRPKVEVYEGRDGIRTLMNNIFKLNLKELLSYGSSRSFYEVDPYFIEHWHQKRISKKILVKNIYNDTKETRERIKNFRESLELTKYKFLPTKVESPTPTIIYGEKIVFFHLVKKDPFAVLIEDKEMAKNHKKYFEQLWKTAKK